ncbi:MAG TPA: HAMP domain-containing sensor histidine kinase [Cytophagaceae bacterium]|nr:HAMP domain-containing sensor histidine kinase [Cytophagaceae bacterium]
MTQYPGSTTPDIKIPVRRVNKDSMDIMKFIRLKLLRKFIDLRSLSKKHIPYDEIIRIELLVAMCLISFTCGITYIIVGLFVGLSLLSILNYLIFFLTAVPTVLYLTRKGYYNQAKLIMMILGGIFMIIKAASVGPGAGMNLSMLITLFATFAFYSIEDYKYIFLSLTITIGSILFLEVTNYSYLGIDPSTNKYEYEFNYISTILFCILFFYVILRVNQYMNKKLSTLNNKLSRKNRKLSKINEELDSYIYKASHDMRAPITSMMGILSLVKMENDPEKVGYLIELQESCLIKLDNHIHQIIDLSKNIKTESTPKKIDFNNMLKEIFEELSFFENAANTKKIITIDQTLDFYSDPYRLKMVVNNLVTNAFKYAQPKEASPVIKINAVITAHAATITVKDNGIGIPEDQQSKIFDMFYRGTEISKGSGLGLYMVKEMIQKLNGTISVTSEVNHFTSITFILPNHLR